MSNSKILISMCAAIAVGLICYVFADMVWVATNTQLDLVKHFGVGLAVGGTFLITKSKIS